MFANSVVRKAIPETDAAKPAECKSARHNRFSLIVTSPARCQQATAAGADRGGVFHGVTGHHDSKYRSADDRGGVARRSAQHEVSAGQLYAEPCGFHSNQRVDGG